MLVPLFFLGSIEVLICNLKSSLFSETNLEHNYLRDTKNYDWIKSLKNDSLIILAGSSSVKYGLSCKMLNNLDSGKHKYVNIAMDARDPIQTYFLIKNIDTKNVSSVYFGLDPWIYSKTYYLHRNNYLYLDFSFLQILNFFNEHDKSAFLKRYKNFYKYLFPDEIYNSFYKINDTPPSDFGSVIIDGKATNFNFPINESFQIDKYGWSDLQFIYLQKIANLCKEKNIKFSVFIPPKRSDFSKIYKEKCQLIHYQYVRKLLNVGLNSQIFGGFDQLDKLGDYDNFTEAYHLNKKGQELYSRIFYELTTNQTIHFSENYEWFSKNENGNSKINDTKQ